MFNDDLITTTISRERRRRRDGRLRFAAVCATSAILATASAAHAQQATAPAPQDPDARARAIVARMTLDEKITELHGVQSKTQGRTVPPIPRLGIPGLNITNGPAGVGNGGPGHQGKATALPAPISLAATWDIEMATLNGVVAGSETAELANGLIEAPDINIARVPRNGRTFEGFGEDPYLAGRMAAANIKAIQSQGVIANVKHYAGNNQETKRTSVSDDVDERTLREIYLPAFEAAIRDGHCGSLMGAYNKVNGTFCCENDFLLNQVLKKDWGFEGFVTSDFGAVHSTVGCAMGGLDLEMPTGKFFAAALKDAVTANTVPMSVIDDKLVRRFRTMMRLGVWDHPPTLSAIPGVENGRKARLLAEEGIVLLKNADAQLPLAAESLHSIAVIGPFAEKAMTGGGGSSRVNPLYSIAPVAGIQSRVGSAVTVTSVDGLDLASATAAAKAADVAIVMVGDRESEGRDHALSLNGNQDALIEAVAAANRHTVVVLKSGSAILMPWVDKVPAIIEAWYPGEEDGTAVAAVLFGDFNPSGKLPITFPKSLDDVAANTPARYPGADGVVHYSEGVFVGYRHYDAKKIEPLFPFGHGLSYTTFRYRNLKVTTDAAFASGTAAGQTATVDLDVTNIGERTGAEIVEVYVGIPALPDVPQPPQQLKGFQRVSLDAGKTAHVHLTLDARAFAYWRESSHDWQIPAGTYRILVGSSSRDIRLRGEVGVR